MYSHDLTVKGTTLEAEYKRGYETATEEIAAGKANRDLAKQRDHGGTQDERIAWDLGYHVACIAYRLGYEPKELIAIGLYECGAVADSDIVEQLLDGTWVGPVRPDPRGP